MILIGQKMCELRTKIKRKTSKSYWIFTPSNKISFCVCVCINE